MNHFENCASLRLGRRYYSIFDSGQAEKIKKQISFPEKKKPD